MPAAARAQPPGSRTGNARTPLSDLPAILPGVDDGATDWDAVVAGIEQRLDELRKLVEDYVIGEYEADFD